MRLKWRDAAAMNEIDYGHFLQGGVFMLAAVCWVCSVRLTKGGPRWRFPFPACQMSPRSLRIMVCWMVSLGVWEILRGFYPLRPTLLILGMMSLFVGAVLVSYYRDRRESRRSGEVG